MNTQLQAPAFEVAGSLPRGVTVLEASAGTGKTYAIAALAARYVADGTPLERVLLVTFTRMATGELRERVRERLVSVLHGLDQVLAGVLFTWLRRVFRPADALLASVCQLSESFLGMPVECMQHAANGFIVYEVEYTACSSIVFPVRPGAIQRVLQDRQLVGVVAHVVEQSCQ